MLIHKGRTVAQTAGDVPANRNNHRRFKNMDRQQWHAREEANQIPGTDKPIPGSSQRTSWSDVRTLKSPFSKPLLAQIKVACASDPSLFKKSTLL